MRANNLYCVEFGTKHNYLIIWVHSAIFLTVILWAFWGKLSPHAVSCFLFSYPSSYDVSALPSPIPLHWAASGPDVAGGKPDDPVWAPLSSSTVSSEKTLVPRQRVFPDDSMDMRLKRCCNSLNRAKGWVNRSFVNGVNISNKIHEHFREASSSFLTGL